MSDPILRIRDLSVHYGDRHALAGVDAEIHRGRVHAVLGPSGCGKSTFLACLNRMTDLIPGCRVTGSIHLGDDAISDRACDTVALRRRVGMIFQRPNPFPLSIRRNLDLPLIEHGLRDRDQRRDVVERTLRDVGLWDEVADRLDASALDLSGGQQQRLCLARALALDPEVLLLDEPTSALDPLAAATVEELIRSLGERYTVVLVTHHLPLARRLADDVSIFWLRDGAGRLIESGTCEQVFTAPEDPDASAYVRGLRG
ncbi:MAG: phosphate ABC transporter ATP-binding protein [Acidobacteriota bacterium]